MRIRADEDVTVEEQLSDHLPAAGDQAVRHLDGPDPTLQSERTSQGCGRGRPVGVRSRVYGADEDLAPLELKTRLQPSLFRARHDEPELARPAREVPVELCLDLEITGRGANVREGVMLDRAAPAMIRLLAAGAGLTWSKVVADERAWR